MKGKSFTKKGVALNKAKNKMKAIINKRLATTGNKKGYAIALDGQEMCTTKALMNAGWTKKQVWLPNFSEDFHIIKKKHALTFPITLNEMIKRFIVMERKIGYIYMDYMCHFYGNKSQKVDPRKDLIALFESKLLLTDSIIGITCAHRSKFGPKENGFTNNSMMEAIEFVQNAAYLNGYRLLLDGKHCGSYKNGGAMFTLIFKVKK